jgi:hypothetical protein
VSEIRVSSWAELQDALFEDSWSSALARFRSPFVFRGLPRVAHGLETSLQTGGFVPQERHLLTSFRKYALRAAVHGDLIWHWLSLAKHHGLPTRLLDWSYSPLVALHFATHDVRHFDEDGAIWCVDYRRTNELLPRRLRNILAEHDANIFTTEMLQAVAQSMEEFEALSRRDFVLFFEPPSLDERIVNQFALFSLPSRADLVLHEMLAREDANYRRVIIPASLKWEVRDKLDQANITERVLFPGLDGLSAWLKRYFTTRQLPASDETPAGRARSRRR